MTTTAAEQPPEQTTEVVWLNWDQYLQWMSGRLRRVPATYGTVTLGRAWGPGQHGALIGPTGGGKTTHAVGILSLRNYVLALDPKGEDETLSASGYTRVRDLPKEGWQSLRGRDQAEWRRIHKDIEEGRPARVLVGGGASTDQEDFKLHELMRDSITYARHTGGWTLYVDEFELLSSQRMFRLGPNIERMLITARRAKTSVITSFQAPAWVSKHATRQAHWAVMWPTGSRKMIQNVAEEMGRDWREVATVVDQLPEFHTVTIPRGKNGGPLVITHAPKIN